MMMMMMCRFFRREGQVRSQSITPDVPSHRGFRFLAPSILLRQKCRLGNSASVNAPPLKETMTKRNSPVGTTKSLPHSRSGSPRRQQSAASARHVFAEARPEFAGLAIPRSPRADTDGPVHGDGCNSATFAWTSPSTCLRSCNGSFEESAEVGGACGPMKAFVHGGSERSCTAGAGSAREGGRGLEPGPSQNTHALWHCRKGQIQGITRELAAPFRLTIDVRGCVTVNPSTP